MAVKITITESKGSGAGAEVSVEGATSISKADYVSFLNDAVEELNMRIDAAQNDEGDAFEEDMAEDEE